MPRKLNKWLYGWKLYVDYGCGTGWTYETFEETFKEYKENRIAYQKNCPYPQKWSRGRELNPEWETAQLKAQEDAIYKDCNFPGFSTAEDRREMVQLKNVFFKTVKYLNLNKTQELVASVCSGWMYTLRILIPHKFRQGGSTVYFRDPEGNRIMNARGYLFFDSTINPNGITGPEDIGRTYTLHLEIKGTVKGFRCRRWEEDTTIANVYVYGRTPEESCSKFAEACKTRIPDWLRGRILNTTKEIEALGSAVAETVQP